MKVFVFIIAVFLSVSTAYTQDINTNQLQKANGPGFIIKTRPDGTPTLVKDSSLNSARADTLFMHLHKTETVSGDKTFTGAVYGDDIYLNRLGMRDLANGYYNVLYYADQDLIYQKGNGYEVHLVFPDGPYTNKSYLFPFAGRNQFKLLSSVNGIEAGDDGNVNISLTGSSTLQNDYDNSDEAGDNPTIFGKVKIKAPAKAGTNYAIFEINGSETDLGVVNEDEDDLATIKFSEQNGIQFYSSENRYSFQNRVYTFPTTLANAGDVLTATAVNNGNVILAWQPGASGGIGTETDPTVPSYVKSISTTNITNWNTAFGWGNHATAGYELQTNKSTSTSLGTSNILFPTQNAAKVYTDNAVATRLNTAAPASSGGTPTINDATPSGTISNISISGTNAAMEVSFTVNSGQSVGGSLFTINYNTSGTIWNARPKVVPGWNITSGNTFDIIKLEAKAISTSEVDVVAQIPSPGTYTFTILSMQ